MRSVFSPFTTTQTKVVNLDYKSFEEQHKGDDNAVLLDVRTNPEHIEVRIPGSEVLDFYGIDFRSRISQLDKSKNYYLYCRSGNRSYQAGLMMSQMGFENVYNLQPGIIGWYGEVEQG